MGYITNYSYCTAMVSFVFWKSTCKNIPPEHLPASKKNTCKISTAIKAKCSHNLPVAPCKLLFYLVKSSKFTSCSSFSSPGVRTEQDLYIRLIDSMTKQVSCCCTFPPFLSFPLFPKRTTVQHGARRPVHKQRVVEIVAPTATKKR